jgi:flagellin
MAEQSNILDTVKSKLIQANTDTTSTDGRKAIAGDIKKLLEQLNNISKQTNYNGRQLIGSATGTSSASAHNFQIGEKATDVIKTTTITANTTGLAIGTALSSVVADGVMTKGEASTAQTAVNTAITKLNTFRAEIGSTQNQVESAVRNLMTQATNVTAAESIIRDVDYAQESANFNKQNIISQAGSYAISQANSVQQNVLRLLQ